MLGITSLCAVVLIVGVAHGSSTAMPVGNLNGWRQIFTDDFTTNVALGSFPGPYANKWTSYTGFTDTSGKGDYDMYKVLSVSNGMLDFYMHTDPSTQRPLGAAPVPFLAGNGQWGGQIYGRYSLRFRSDSLPGYSTGWLLWPDTNVWDEGEIDFPEGGLDGTIHAYDHCVNNPQTNCFANDTGVTFTSWHIATIEWTPAHVQFILDNVVVGVASGSNRVPSTQFHWVLQACTTGVTPNPSVAGHLQIDWAVVYAYDTTAVAPPTPVPSCTAANGVWTDSFTTLNAAHWAASSGGTWGQTDFKSSQVKAGSTGLTLNMTKSGCPSQCAGLAEQSGKISAVNNYQFGTIQASIQATPYGNLWLGWESSGPRDGWEIKWAGNDVAIQYYTNDAYAWVGEYILPFNISSALHKYTIARTSTSLKLYADGGLVATASGSGLPQSSGQISFTLQADDTISTQTTTARLSAFTYLPVGCPYTA